MLPAEVVNASHFALSFGTLDGPGTLNVSDALNWSSRDDAGRRLDARGHHCDFRA